MLIAAGGLATAAGALKLATRFAASNDRSQRLPASVPVLAVAVPTGGDSRDVSTNRPLLAAVKRVLSDAEQAGQGRFRLTLQEVAQPPRPAPPATPTPQMMVLAPLMASGAPPDLLAFTSVSNPGNVPNELALVADSRALVPLDDFWKGSVPLNLSELHQPALDLCRQRGKLIAVPLMAAPLLLAYDARRFRGAAVTPPDDTWGWNDLRDTARRLTSVASSAGAGRDQYGLVPYPSTASLLSLIWQNGGDVISADKSRATLADNPVREAIEYFASFYAPDGPGSPTEQFSGWVWNSEGVRVNKRSWAAMTHAPMPGSFDPPVPTLTYAVKQTLGHWAESVLDALGSDAAVGSPMRLAPLPKGRQRATAMLVTATISVSHKSSDPELAAHALALLAERVTKTVLPSARRMPVAEMP